MSKKSDLAIRETILGVIKAKDLNGRGVIHSSDFRNAIKDLGFPPGSSIIENILVHCKLDASGNMDYSSLERELIRERRVFNADLSNKPKQISTSSATAPKPWRTDVIHQQKVSSERQSKLVQEHRATVHEIYNLLSHHGVTSDDALFHLGQLEIYPTKEFSKVLTTMSTSEVAFAEFVRSLTQSDPNNSQLLEDRNISAGGSKKPVHIDDTFGSQRKRSAMANQTNFFGDHNEEKPRSTRKIASSDSNAITDQTIFKTTRVKDAIFSDQDNVSLLSHAQHDMVKGAYAENKHENIELAFNSEQKLQREQVLAAIRKLHSGELSMEDFQDKLFAMGFDLPETVAAELRRAVAAGTLDQRKFVRMLDATIFKVSAMEDRRAASEAKVFQQRFVTSIRQRGMSSVLELGQLFRRFDLDGDGSLSFSEFKQGIRDFDIRDLSDSELRILFNSFDKNGDGVLQSSEFLDAIRGELNSKRIKVVRTAFLKLNRFAAESVSLDDVVEQFQAANHPEVESGEKSERDVTHEFVLWFANAPGFSGSITQSDFEEYFASISGYIANDGVFEGVVRALWGLDDTHAPPPPEYHQRQGPPVPPPQAKQSHGDLVTWGQQKTRLEINMAGVEKGKRVVWGYENKNLHTNVKLSQDKVLGTKALDFVPEEEYKIKGSVKVVPGMKNISSAGLTLNWSQTGKTKPTTPVKPTTHQVSLNTNSPQSPSPVLPYQLDVPQAGNPSYTKRNLNDNPAYNWSDIRRAHHGTAPPFGVDPRPTSKSTAGNEGGASLASYAAANGGQRAHFNNNSGSSSGGGGGSQVRSLSEAIKEKKSEPRSLASLMAQQQQQR